MGSTILDNTETPIEKESRSQRRVREFFRNHWAVILANLIAIIGLFASIGSIMLSKDSNRIANDALETSRFHYIQINRPYIAISPKAYSDGLYWKLVREGSAVRATLKYELKNIGNVAAKDITLPNLLAIGPTTNLKKGAELDYTRPQPLTLGPGDNLRMTPSIFMGFEDEEAASLNLKRWASGKSKGMTFLVSVEYKSELDGSKKYRSFMENRINRDRAQIIRSEMIAVQADEDVGGEN